VEVTPEEFESLLSLFGPDRDRAAERYEITRRKLIRLFEWWGCELAEEKTDESFDRVAANLVKGLELQKPDPYSYFCGVARFVYKEYARDRAKEKAWIDSDELRRRYPIAQEGDPEDPRLAGLRRCLDRQPGEDSQLLLDYYPDKDRIQVRQQLAGKLGLSVNALRIKVHRIRQKVVECVARRLGARER
jgi:hypothetical protein